MYYLTVNFNSDYMMGFHSGKLCTLKMFNLELETIFHKTRMFRGLNI